MNRLTAHGIVHEALRHGRDVMVIEATSTEARIAMDVCMVATSNPSEIERATRAYGREEIVYPHGGRIQFVTANHGLDAQTRGRTPGLLYVDRDALAIPGVEFAIRAIRATGCEVVGA